MTENEKLRALLAEARMYLTMNGGSADDRIVRRIDAALAEPVDSQKSVVEPDYYGMRDQLYELRTEYLRQAEALIEREKTIRAASRERDEARAEVARLRWGNEMACENTPTKGCECPGCGLARERAERGEDGP